jgi:hypothetical protein
MNIAEEMAADLAGQEPEVDLEQGTVDGEEYETSRLDDFYRDDDHGEEEDIQAKDVEPKPESTAEEQTSEEGDQESDKPAPDQPPTIQALQQQNQNLQRTIHNMEQRFQQVVERFQRPPEQQPAQQPKTVEERIAELGPRPDPVEDIEGFDKWTNAAQEIRESAQKEELEAIKKRVDSQDEQQLFNQTLNQVTTQIEQAEAKVRQTNPEYPDALKFLRQQYVKEQQERGRAGTEEQFLSEAMNLEVIAGINMAMRGQNPAMMVLQLAERHGFKKPEQTPADNPNAEKLERIEQGQQRNKQHGSGGKAVSLEKLSTSDEESFEEAMGAFMSDVDFRSPML